MVTALLTDGMLDETIDHLRELVGIGGRQGKP